MDARHLRGRARSYDPYRGVSGVRLDGALPRVFQGIHVNVEQLWPDKIIIRG
jgi:hypothetical protein